MIWIYLIMVIQYIGLAETSLLDICITRDVISEGIEILDGTTLV